MEHIDTYMLCACFNLLNVATHIQTLAEISAYTASLCISHVPMLQAYSRLTFVILQYILASIVSPVVVDSNRF